MSDVIKRKPGRPVGSGLTHLVTDEQRQLVRVLAANGISQRIIAANINIEVGVLKKYYRTELRDGLERVEAAMGASIVKAALAGNWNAARYWLLVNGKDQRWRDAQKFLREEAEAMAAINGEDGEVVHFYMPPNYRDEPDTEEPPTIEGEVAA
jgi:hypothetical protein